MHFYECSLNFHRMVTVIEKIPSPAPPPVRPPQFLLPVPRLVSHTITTNDVRRRMQQLSTADKVCE